MSLGVGAASLGCRGAAHPTSATQLVLTLRDYDTSRHRDLSAALHQVRGVYDMTLDSANMQVAVFVEPTVTPAVLRIEAAKSGFILVEGGGKGSYVSPAGWSQGSDVIFLNADGDDFPALPLSSGSYTVVEFTAEWCPACHLLANEIKRLLIHRKDIAYRVIDVGQFGSPAQQHWGSRLRSLPYVIVYTPEQTILVEHAGYKPGWLVQTIDDHARGRGVTTGSTRP